MVPVEGSDESGDWPVKLASAPGRSEPLVDGEAGSERVGIPGALGSMGGEVAGMGRVSVEVVDIVGRLRRGF